MEGERWVSDLLNSYLQLLFGGGRGIRTPGTVSGSVVFKTTAIDHSAISPHGQFSRYQRVARFIDFTTTLSNYEVFGADGDNLGDTHGPPVVKCVVHFR